MNAVRQHDDKRVNILYSRLSREDESDFESNSIRNQKSILEDFAVKNGFMPFIHISDDGYSGTNFIRPGWQDLIARVEAGEVKSLILKDGSRLGRDYLRVGLYREMFREKGVRLICLQEGTDTDKGDDDFTPFREIMAEWYARDTSRKVKTVLRSKGNAGKPLTHKVIYGYKKSEADKNVWEIDPEPAETVRNVFRMALGGLGPFQIAGKLAEAKIERPAAYYARMRGWTDKYPENAYAWSEYTISQMLRREEYIGNTVNFRTEKDSYKSKKFHFNPKEDWKIFKGTHPAIIDAETFETVQRLRGTPRRPGDCGEANPMTGLVYCSDCNRKMYNSRQSKPFYIERKKNGKELRHKRLDFYTCSTNSPGARRHNETCTMHYIRTEVLRELVLDAIRNVCAYVRGNEAEFAAKIRESSVIRQVETAKSHKKQLGKNERRIAELDLLFRKVYEDNATGKLSDERFEQLSTTYEREQAELKQQNAGLRSELDAWDADSEKADRFIDIVRHYTAFDELTTPMLNEFAQRIIVHEADKSSGERVQQVDIYFNFIGRFELPEAEAPPTPEELAAEEARLKKLAKQREYNRRWYEKKKQKTKTT